MCCMQGNCCNAASPIVFTRYRLSRQSTRRQWYRLHKRALLLCGIPEGACPCANSCFDSFDFDGGASLPIRLTKKSCVSRIYALHNTRTSLKNSCQFLYHGAHSTIILFFFPSHHLKLLSMFFGRTALVMIIQCRVRPTFDWLEASLQFSHVHIIWPSAQQTYVHHIHVIQKETVVNFNLFGNPMAFCERVSITMSLVFELSVIPQPNCNTKPCAQWTTNMVSFPTDEFHYARLLACFAP